MGYDWHDKAVTTLIWYDMALSRPLIMVIIHLKLAGRSDIFVACFRRFLPIWLVLAKGKKPEKAAVAGFSAFWHRFCCIEKRRR
jgi:hypothetical protein